MRALYLLLKFVLKFSLWVYYPRTRKVNEPKKRFARTIFVSNHAASFMDPLVVASNQRPVVFFMTRSDVFKPFLKPILWASHMLPIYRSQDGEDTKKKNEEVFAKCNRILKNGRNLIIFAEGFTDDTFIRRLKPIKKGAVRIGFGALEEINWCKNIYLQAVGVNYTDPNVLGSSVVISNGNKICLNDYKTEFKTNPNKVITELTKLVEGELQEQLTHIVKADKAPFHEQVMELTRKGMSPHSFSKNIRLLDRWKYSKNLAKWFNQQDWENNEKLNSLKQNTERYFSLVKRAKLEEKYMHYAANNKETNFKDLLFLIFLLPVTLIGLIHGYLPYTITKGFVEKSMKRKVFWGSVKMMVGTVFYGIWNILLITCMNYLVLRNPGFWTIYFFFIPMLSGLIAYNWMKRLKDYKTKAMIDKQDLSKLLAMRKNVIEQVKETIPVA